ncbi:MAG: beta-ketoacyl synthase N-terminal-like domain-containing protein [Chloroflexota bacterium]|nr:beta-ketoacyl synthase N-terminal-like domain-containing protein [Chloroflexota bacterium]
MAIQPKLGRSVALVGAGMSKFGAFPEKASRDLFVEAFQEMRASVSRGLDPRDIEALYIGNYSSDLFEGQGHMAPLMADWVGLTPRPAIRVEDACASSGVALRQGIIAIASGLYDVVLVGGIEKMSNLSTEKVTDALSTASDILYEIPAGFTFPGFYAAMATAYMDRFSATPEAFMQVGMKNHDNGALNPKAQFSASIADVMEGKQRRAQARGLPIPQWTDEMDFLHDNRANPMIAWPLRLFDCSPISDGAAALLLVGGELADNFCTDPVYIIGSGQASDRSMHDREELTSIGAAVLASQQAYQMAGVSPADVKVAEVHDCFTIAEIIATEDLGFFEPGEGFVAAEEGLTTRNGLRPVNTSGGLKAKGHPVGASGAAQVVEIWKQMQGLAGERQLAADVEIALTHNVGGTGQTCVVHIFERR